MQKKVTCYAKKQKDLELHEKKNEQMTILKGQRS